MSAALTTDVDKRLLRTTKFPPEFNKKVDTTKVKSEVITTWAAGELKRILGDVDEILSLLVSGFILDNRYPNIKELQISLTGFLDKEAPGFCQHLWNLLLSAQESETGVPKELLEAKKTELINERIEEARQREEAQKQQDAERERERNMARIRERERGYSNRSGYPNRRGGRGGRDRRDRPPRRDSRSPPPRRGRNDDDSYRRGTDSYVPSGDRQRRRSPSMSQDVTAARHLASAGIVEFAHDRLGVTVIVAAAQFPATAVLRRGAAFPNSVGIEDKTPTNSGADTPIPFPLDFPIYMDPKRWWNINQAGKPFPLHQDQLSSGSSRDTIYGTAAPASRRKIAGPKSRELFPGPRRGTILGGMRTHRLGSESHQAAKQKTGAILPSQSASMTRSMPSVAQHAAPAPDPMPASPDKQEQPLMERKMQEKKKKFITQRDSGWYPSLSKRKDSFNDPANIERRRTMSSAKLRATHFRIGRYVFKTRIARPPASLAVAGRPTQDMHFMGFGGRRS
ncbi:hypothetical protein KC349_g273 [Hortaea werneckii]|nr:hypothetical protein KC349_g273 [Hortaea werneckii]